MTLPGILSIAVYLGIVFPLVKPLGWYMARVYTGKSVGLERILGPLERLYYRILGIHPTAEQSWKSYAAAMLLVNLFGIVALYLLQRFQAILPLNPGSFAAPSPAAAFNVAVSFATNTNWQNYSGETTYSYLVQMIGFTSQNFISAAVGMSVFAALARGLGRQNSPTIGHFWVDLIRSVLYILLPLSIMLAILLVSQGVVQNLNPPVPAQLVEHISDNTGAMVTTQLLPMGPAASQIAIKQLGTNGGGFFNVNSAHPFENPTPLSNILQLLAILLIPAALCYTFGVLVGDPRQGWAILAAMTTIFVVLLAVTIGAEAHGNPRLAALGIDQSATLLQPGGNMEGKELRFGINESALWAVATTAASNGSVNSMHDSYTPIGGMIPLWLMQTGEVIFGGVGSGLYGMLIFVLVTVFIAGLMVGRTPEYLGKKIEGFEMKMASIAILVPAIITLGGAALALGVHAGGFQDSGPHGLSELLYAYASMGNNNGSAFAGFDADTPWHNIVGGLVMLFARYWVALPALAIAGSLAARKQVAEGPGTLPTHTPLFIILLIGVVLIVGALTFVPALMLGPIAEYLMLRS
ncbi:MAG TPA: potassium-transporting ATPase subunit KdpA [Roseiflexaceae bacterium]|nr:potassium-transporting ATPase subunit KdpA [Roseiflexaceae bacterium]